MALIRNKRTGEMMEVDDTQVQQYVKPTVQPAQPTAQQGMTVDTATTPTVPASSTNVKTLTGRTLEQHRSALEKARLAGDTAAIKVIEKDFDDEYKYQTDTGGIKKMEEAGKSTKVKEDVIAYAKQLQDLVKNKDKYSPEQYESAKSSLASNIILKKKEAENLGAAFSGNELAILSGQVPVTQSIGGSFPQRVGAFFTGREPVQRGEVVESDEELDRKMSLLIAGLEGREVDPSIFTPREKKNEGLDIADAVGGFLEENFIDPINNYAKDAGAGMALNTKDGQNMQASQDEAISMAQEAMKRADEMQKTNPEQAKRFRDLANKTLSQVGLSANDTGDSFSEDINDNYVARSVHTASAIAGAAEAPGVIGGVKTLVRHPIQSTKGIVGAGKEVVKNPLGVAKNIIDDPNTFTYQGTGLPTSNTANIADEVIEPKIIDPTQPTQPNVGQTVARQTTDFINGGGSSKYISRQAKKPWLPPQNQVLQQEGVYSHPTKNGRIQAASKAIDRYGSELETMYTNSPTTFSTAELQKKALDELLDNGVPVEEAETIVNKISTDLRARGSFDLASQDSIVDAKSLWEGTRWLEKYNPRIPKDPDATAYLKENSQVLTRLFRDELGEAIPETKIVNGKYSALKDFADNDYEIKGGAMGTADNLLRTAATPIKNTINTTLNVASNPRASVKSYLPASKTPPPPREGLTMADGASAVDEPAFMNTGPTQAINQPLEGASETEMPFKKLIRDKRMSVDNPKAFRELDNSRASSKNAGMAIDEAVETQELKRLNYDPTRLEKRIMPPNTAGNPSDSFEVQIRYKGFAADKKSFKTKAEAQAFLDNYKFEGLSKSVAEDYEGTSFDPFRRDSVDKSGSELQEKVRSGITSEISSKGPDGDIEYLAKRALADGDLTAAGEYFDQLPNTNKWKQGMQSFFDKRTPPAGSKKK